MLQHMLRRFVNVLGVAWLLTACGNEDSIALNASIQQAQLGVNDVALGTQLTGQFELRLEVGSQAESASTVSLESFSLRRASDRSTVLSTLAVAPDGVTFPLSVGKGETRIVPFQLDDQTLLSPTERAAICVDSVQITGTVTDSLTGGQSTPLTSIALNISGC